MLIRFALLKPSNARQSILLYNNFSDSLKYSKIFKKNDIKVSIPISDEVLLSQSLSTANSKELLKYKIGNHFQKFKLHPTDTGSSALQIASMTEKIVNLARHLAINKKDKRSLRGFDMLVAKRRSMMQYMKKNDLVGFQRIVVHLGIQKEALNLK